MKINTFGIVEYRGCPTYFRNFGNYFEYLFIYKNELYTKGFSVNPRFINKILWLVGLEENKYSQQQLSDIIKQLHKTAEQSVDFVLDKK